MAEANPYVSPTDDLVSEQKLAVKPEFFSMSQRIGRIRYLAYNSVYMLVFYLILAVLGVAAAVSTAGESVPVVSIVVAGLVYLCFLFASIVLGIRRLHDLDKSGLFYLLNLVPVVNIGLVVYMVFFPGSEAENSFGQKPEPNTVWTWILGLVLPFIMSAMIGILAAIALPAYQDYVERAQQAESQY